MRVRGDATHLGYLLCSGGTIVVSPLVLKEAYASWCAPGDPVC